MNSLSAVFSLLTLLLPMLALAWLYRTRAKSRLYFLALALFVITFITTTVFSYGYWFAVGMYWPIILVGALIVILFIRFKRGLPAEWLPR